MSGTEGVFVVTRWQFAQVWVRATSKPPTHLPCNSKPPTHLLCDVQNLLRICDAMSSADICYASTCLPCDVQY
eukprot:2181415-Rhodomonas_salina.2